MTHCHVTLPGHTLNTIAWADPTAYHFGTSSVLATNKLTLYKNPHQIFTYLTPAYVICDF